MCGTETIGPALMMLYSCHSGPSTRHPYSAGETSGGSRHLGVIFLGQRLTHCSQLLNLHRPHRQPSLTSSPLSGRYSMTSSLRLTQYPSGVMGLSQPQFVKSLVTSLVVLPSASHTSTRWWLVIGVVFQWMHTAHLHSLAWSKCSTSTSMKMISAHPFHYRQQ